MSSSESVDGLDDGLFEDCGDLEGLFDGFVSPSSSSKPKTEVETVQPATTETDSGTHHLPLLILQVSPLRKKPSGLVISMPPKNGKKTR